jgi:outer membrane immunogenic protein
MKKTVLAAAFVMVSAPAFAADLAPFHSQNVVVPAAAYDWTGVYVGVNAGGGFGGNATGQLGPFIFKGAANGFLGGATVGYNYQIGRFVIGAEGDFDWSNLGNKAGIFGGLFTLKTKANWLATARARVGWTPWDTALVYVTGGAAFTNATENLLIFGALLKDSRTHTGWTVGAGVETALGHSNWTVKAEYLYTRFGGEKYFTRVFIPGVKAKLDSHIIRVGLNYRF